MSLIRQACACLRARPIASRALSTTPSLFADPHAGPSRARRPSTARSTGQSEGGTGNTAPNNDRRHRQPGTSRKHTPVEGFELPAPRVSGQRVERGGSSRRGGREMFGSGSGSGSGYRSGLPRSDRHVREAEDPRRGTGFGMVRKKQPQSNEGPGGLVMRRRPPPGAHVASEGQRSNVAEASRGQGVEVSDSADAGSAVLEELSAFDEPSMAPSRGKGRDDDRHGGLVRSRGRDAHTAHSSRGGRGGEAEPRSSRSFLDQLDDDGEFVISRNNNNSNNNRNTHTRGGRGGGGIDTGRDAHAGRSHKANARAAQQAILYGHGSADRGGKGPKVRKDNPNEDGDRQGRGKKVEVKEEKKVFIPSSVSVGRLADIFGVKIFNLQNVMRKLGLSEEQRRSDYLLTSEQACDIAIEYDLDPIVDDEAAFDIFPEPESSSSSSNHPLRPPVVTIMGHVDHGKTTLLDSLRRTSVAAGEAGGITQHIGAFSVALADILPSASSPSSSTSGSAGAGGAGSGSPGSITFLDTPGHAAFTAMRARGASATDLVVLVVAADDGVMPQTKEVIELVRRDGDKVGLVVAINKCDKAGVDFDKVKSALGAEGVLLEEDGGDTPSVRVSGLTGLGLDQLVETLSTLAEMRELRARKDGTAEGIVLESRVDRGRGNVATVLVQKGTLTSGTSIVAGTTWAKVRQMQDSSGRPLKSAGPGTPVSLTGWKDLPTAGDVLLQAPTEDDAKRAISNRLRDIERRKMLADVEQINEKRAAQRLRAEADEKKLEQMKAEGRSDAEVAAFMREVERRDAKGEAAPGLGGAESSAEGSAAGGGGAGEEGKKWLNLVIKADVSGTVEAVVGSLESIGNKEAGVKIVGTGVGEVGESDVNMAEATGATIVAFSVPVPKPIESLATASSVPLRASKIIYELIERVRQDVAALLPPLKEIRVSGEATVQQIFDIKLKGKETLRIAGSRVSNGVVEMKEGVRARVLRGAGREVVHEGVISTLKHLKKDVTEVRKGTECGIGLEGFTDIREGDEIVTFTTVDVPRTL